MNLLSAFGGEVWKDIDGYDGKYQVSSLGRIKSFAQKNRCGLIMKQKVDRYGYLVISLSMGKTKNHITVHRLVALQFIPNPLNLPQVNHKNGVKTGNKVSDLEWCTVSQNVQHSFDVLNKPAPWAGKKRGRHLDTGRAKRIAQIDPITNKVVRVWERMNDAARAGFHQSKLSQVCNGKREQTGNFKWAFTNN